MLHNVHGRATHAITMISLASALSMSPTNDVQAKPWGACGRSTPEGKEVATYYKTSRSYYTLRCGTEAYGYRHILKRHRTDFEALALGTYQNWRDVIDLAVKSIASDPDAAVSRNDGKSCLSRVIFLRNLRTNQIVRQQIVRMIFRNSDNAIVSVYPSGQQCTKG